MNISSRTPEGLPHRCPLCGEVANLEPAWPGGDAVCPRCGQLVWWIRDRIGDDERLAALLKALTSESGLDSIDMVELIMELEEEMDINLPDDAAERIQSPSDLLRFLREQLGLREDDLPE